MDSLLLTGEVLIGLALIAAVYELDEWRYKRKVRRIVERLREADLRSPVAASHLMPWRGKHAPVRATFFQRLMGAK